MKREKTHLTSLLLALFLLVTLITPAAAAETADLAGLTDSYTANGETFVLTKESRFFVLTDAETDHVSEAMSAELLQTVELAQRQYAADGYDLAIVWGPEAYSRDGDILIELDEGAGMAEEAYALKVAGSTRVTAGDVDGMLYGLNMLQKHFRVGGTTLMGFTAEDAPDTIERTVMLDCGRKYFTKDWICNFIRQCSWMGYNTIELHFSEDGGFRMDFWDPAFYTGSFQPENDFSWLCGSLPQDWVESYYRENEVDRDKYLTTAEIVEILETAGEYHMDVIPSFDSPAHVDYLTWKYERNYVANSNSFRFLHNGVEYVEQDGCINYTNVTGYTTTADWPSYSAININDSVARAFIFEIYEDTANFFKEYAGSTKYNIATDEVALSYSGLWDYGDFPDYVNELDELLNDLGYTTRAFNDFLGTANSSYTSGSGVTLDSFNSDIEILYWNSPFNPTTGRYASDADNYVRPAQDFVDNGRTIYNVIVSSTYFCTRITLSDKDARDPTNRQWQVYHSNEEDIFNEWYPASVREHGDYHETEANCPDIPNDQLGGGYFCLWHDYAALSTEAEIWKGVTDSGKWNVIDRMWSNTIKMWNWDVNDSMTYTEYAAIRDNFGYFPGYTDCSKRAVLPAADTAERGTLADHTALEAALKGKLSGGLYSAESYRIYEEAYEQAAALNADYGATAEAMASAIARLEEAEAGLILKDLGMTVTWLTTVDGKDYQIKTERFYFEAGTSDYALYLRPVSGYCFLRAEGTKFIPLPSEDGGGYITGGLTGDTNVILRFANTPIAGELRDLIADSPTQQGSFSDESWAAYSEVLAEAESYLGSDVLTQKELDEHTQALRNALSGLAYTGAGSAGEIISVEKLTSSVLRDKLAGLKVTTSADVTAITVADQTPAVLTGRVRTLDDGSTVKLWLVAFEADQSGYYTISTGSETEEVYILVQ